MSSSGFSGATVTKTWLLSLTALPIISSIVGLRPYIKLRIVPHITRKFQLWRLFTSATMFSSASDVFTGVLIIYNLRIIERLFGSRKYAAFLFVTGFVSKFLEVAISLILRQPRVNNIVPGPFALIAALVYQYYQLVPATGIVNIFGVNLSSKSGIYLLTAQLFYSRYPNSVAPALAGLAASMIYSSNIANLKQWRFPTSLSNFVSSRLGVYLKSNPPTIPDSLHAHLLQQQHQYQHNRSQNGNNSDPPQQQPPLDEELIELLQGMYPQKPRDEIVRALIQTGNDANRAAMALL
ncbi:hypothetical protein H4219_005596 [Mycoemilia scoparia]|uniref:Derlin n=1 Tax=Mycoemilia scoparia TaxID=417184 RepID=A0A9W8DP76_9FUNG|nr:hypothetical protein H4219_005596 [Mycoemilia scoparia]